MEELQHKNYEIARSADKELERKIRNRHDTRAAAALRTVAASTSKGMSMLRKATTFESILFGPDIEVNNTFIYSFIHLRIIFLILPGYT